MAKKAKADKQQAKAEKGVKYNAKKLDISCETYEWIKKDLGTISADGLYRLVGIEMNGGAALIIEHWELI